MGDEISKTFGHAYHECVHLAMYVAAKAREVGHHPDIDIRWQRIRFGITRHDAGHRITDLDFALARHIDAIAAGHGRSLHRPETPNKSFSPNGPGTCPGTGTVLTPRIA